jgi:DNA-binding transcriptional LysR family regulator
MHLTLRQLQIFVAIAQCGSTTAAAEKVALSQSAISASVGELERSLNVRLFDRVGKRLMLNDHGRAMLPQAMSLIDGAEKLEQSYLNEAPSELVIGASLTIGNYLLPRLLADYWNAQGIKLGDDTPPVQVRVANTGGTISMVANFEFDIGLIEGACHRTDIAVMPWLRDDLLLVASPDHPMVQEYDGRMIPSERLAQANWLLREQGSGTREALEHALLPYMPQLKSSLEFNDHEAIKQAAVHGLGIACLSHVTVKDMLDSGQLIELKTRFGRLNRRFSILTHHQKQLTPGMRNFIAFVSEEKQRGLESA